MKSYYFFTFLAGCLSGLAFAPYSQIWILLFVFALFFAVLTKAQNKRQLFMTGFSFGFGQGAASMFWLTNALLIDPQSFGMLLPLIPLGFGLFFALFFALPALFCNKIKNISARILIFAGLFTIFEWIRSWLFTGFPWNLTGSVWTAFLPVLQTASVIGVYGLTLFSLIWFAIPFLFYKRQYPLAIFGCITFIISAGLGALRLYEIKPEYVWGVQLRLVQPNILQTLKWDENEAEENFMKHIRLSKSKGAEKITHILWSETAVPYLLDIEEEARAMTMMAMRQNATLITGGMRMADKNKRQLANSVFVLDDFGQIVSFYDKSHLVPFGEYVPLRGILPIDKIVPIPSDLKEGNGVQTVRIPNAPPAGILVCYEIIFPGNVVDKKYRPSWLINTTNDGWYGISAGPYQHLAATQMRAVEEGLPIVRVAGSGISAVIYPWGEIMTSLDLNTAGVLDAKLPKNIPNIPFYARLGNIVPMFFSLMFIFFGFILNKKQKTVD